ncbi:MAG: hypothetical protein IT267_08410 [Saprospiraceae bacterium]|nr:hypothetical protein [Saprospiraceae bacterium]
MRLLLLNIYFLIINSICAQNFYSKLYNYNSEIFGSTFGDNILSNDQMIMLSGSACKADNFYYNCSKLLTLDLKGNLINLKELDSLSFIDEFNILVTSGNSIYFGSNSSLLPSNNVVYKKYSKDLKLVYTKIDSSESNSSLVSRGVYLLNDRLYSMEVHNQSNKKPYLIVSRRDTLDFSILWSQNFHLGDFYIDSHDLQLTGDGNLCFIMKSNPKTGVSNLEPMAKVIKISFDGILLDSYETIDLYKKNYASLLHTANQEYYFASHYNPFSSVYTVGSINKLDKDLNLVWSNELINNQIVDGRSYKVARISGFKNGDILITGEVRDSKDSKVIGGDLSTVWNGFLCRINSDGKMKWLRIYKMPQEVLDINTYGQFRPSIIKKATEFENGDILACGDVYYNNIQQSAFPPTDNNLWNMWVLRVDSNGCLPNYPCDTIIRLKNQIKPFREINLNTEWTYEKVDNPAGGPLKEFIPVKVQVIDTIRIKDTLSYITSLKDTIYSEEDRMYFWDGRQKRFILYYNFGSKESYSFPFWSFGFKRVDTAFVRIDSVYYTKVGSDSVFTQLLHVKTTAEDELKIPVYKSIGPATYYYQKLMLGYGLLEVPNPVKDIRCFKSDTRFLNFKNYDCDTTFFNTSVKDLYSIKPSVIVDQVSGEIRIYNLDKSFNYSIYNLDGRLINFGQYKTRILINGSGLFLLNLRTTEGVFTYKLVLP